MNRRIESAYVLVVLLALTGTTRQRLARAVIIAFTAILIGCGGGGSADSPSSPSAPANPANTNLTGTWTGTMTRPAGLDPVAIQVNLTQTQTGDLSGPASLTYNGVSIDAMFSGSFSGDGRSNPVQLTFRLFRTANTSTVLPACNITSNGSFTGFTVAARTLASPAFNITYNSCQGFIAPEGIANFRTESTVLALNKQ